MDKEPKGTLQSVKDFCKNYGQTIFMVGGLVFSSGTLYANVQDVKEKMVRFDGVELEQAKLSVQVNALTQSQTVQSEATNKLADAVNNLTVQVARMEGHEETARSKHR